jgi:DNA-binding protein H-NS
MAFYFSTFQNRMASLLAYTPPGTMLARRKTMNLKFMSVDKLVGLRNRVAATLGTKIAQARRTLESELAKLTRTGKGGRGVRGKVAPKYRNPDNPSETWAGRGLQPRWLAAALKSGKKLEQFAIAAQTRAAATKRTPQKTRRAHKPKKK